MKNTIFPTILFFLLISFNPIYAQVEAWERILPEPQEHDLYCVRQISGTERLVAVGNGSTIMFSDDYGENWDVTTRPAGLNNYTKFISVGFSNENTGYAATDQGIIIRTEDGGESWTIVLNIGNGTSDYGELTAIDEMIALVIGFDSNIYRTADGGQSWDTISCPEDYYPLCIDFINDSTGFIGGTSGTFLLKTFNKGETWFEQPSAGNGMTGQANIYFVNDTIGFATSKLNIFKTIDGGYTWIQKYNYDPGYPIEFLFIDELHGALVTNYTLNDIRYTNDGGETWIPQEDVFSYYTYCYSLGAIQDQIIAVGNNGIVARTINFNEPWEKLSITPNNYNCIKGLFTPGKVGYTINNGAGGIPYSYIMKSTNMGKTWGYAKSFNDGFDGDMSFYNDTIGFLVGGYHESVNFKRTNDGGHTWSELYSFPDSYDFRNEYSNVAFHDSLIGYVTAYNTAYKTVDGGHSWEVIYTTADFPPIQDLYMISPDSVYLLALSMIIKTFDGGESFTYDTLNFENNFPEKFYFINAQTGFIFLKYSYGDSFQKTTDGGESWYEVSFHDTTGAIYNTMTFPSDEVGYAVGKGPYATIIKTTDGGENWYPIENPCTSPLISVHFFDEGHGFIFSDNGAILETYTGGVVGVEENPFVANRNELLVYPNPAKDIVQIKLNEPFDQNIELEIYNLKGQCLIRKHIQNGVSENKLQFNVSALSPGIYYCRIKNGSAYSTAKVVKL